MQGKTASRALLAIVALLAGLCDAQGAGAEGTLVFRIASSEPAPDLVEHHVPGTGDVLFMSQTNIIDGTHVERVSFFRDQQGQRVVGLVFTEEGGERIAIATANNAPTKTPNSGEGNGVTLSNIKRLAVVLDEKVITAPKILGEVGKEVTISGSLSDDELTRIFSSVVLRQNSLAN